MCTLILGNFNAKSSSWWKEDRTTTEGSQLEALTSLHNFHQLISEPTHILPNSNSCIDLIFTDQPNLAVNCGTHSSLNSKCHHQITHCKLNLIIEYPPPYERLVWDYKKANTENIKKSLESVNWETLFDNKSVNTQVCIISETIMNIFSNFVRSKLVTFDDSDPPWMNDFIRNKIKWKDQMHKTYKKNGCKYTDSVKFQEAVSKVSELINIHKEEYQNHIARKLNDPMTNTKTYWSILKTFYNGKKVLVIPLLLINNKLISDFKVKANHFNHFFASQCIPSNNNSKRPENQTYVTNTKLSSVKFEDTEIINIIRSLNVSKAYGHDDISIRMLQICDSAIVKPLSIIFNNCITQSIFPDIWKKSNICPIHKKGDKQAINNYRPVSLLPICGKILERLIFNSFYKYIEENKLLSIHQSGFWCNNSRVNQLLSIVHNIYKEFDAYPTLETRGVFSDMSKAFDKVWHEGLIFKLKSVGVSDSLLSLTESFLSNRFHRVLLNGQTSEWLSVKAGVPQGSILGPLFFLIYINDLSDDIVSTVKLFADDTSVFSAVHNSNTTVKELNKDLQKISEWAYKWKMSFNPDLNKQAQEVVFSRKLNKASQPLITFNNAPVFCANWQKHLGMYLDEFKFQLSY